MPIDFILLSLLVLIVYAWSKEALGIKWAFLPAFLTLLSPHFFSNDVLLALAFLLSIFSFLNFIFHPSRINSLITGLALGAAQLVDPIAIYLFWYFLILICAFYLIGLIRDKNLTSGANHAYRLKVRFFKYSSSLLIIFIIALAIAYIGSIISGQSFNWHFPQAIKMSISNLVLEPLPALILVFLGLGLFLFKINQLKNFSFINYLSNHFSHLSFIIFLILGWYSSEIFPATIPLIYILITSPIKTFMTSQNEKEIMIVIAHEIFSFSAKWLILLILLFWHLIYTFYLISL